MFMLVAVSVMLAAFAPIAVKKLANTAPSSNTKSSYMVVECHTPDNPHFVSDNCMACEENSEGVTVCTLCAEEESAECPGNKEYDMATGSCVCNKTAQDCEAGETFNEENCSCDAPPEPEPEP